MSVYAKCVKRLKQSIERTTVSGLAPAARSILTQISRPSWLPLPILSRAAMCSGVAPVMEFRKSNWCKYVWCEHVENANMHVKNHEANARHWRASG